MVVNPWRAAAAGVASVWGLFVAGPAAWAQGVTGAPRAASAAVPALALSGVNRQGRPFALPDLRGKVVLLFVWSTDCPVCLDKMPEIRRNLEGWKGRDFVVLAVNQNTREADLKAYESALLASGVPAHPQMQWLWRQAPGHRDNLGALSPHLPSTWVLDREGRTVRQHMGRWNPALWDEVAELVLQ
jgi:peroxiredoxin